MIEELFSNIMLNIYCINLEKVKLKSVVLQL